MPKFRENIKRMHLYKPPLEGRGKGDFLLLDFNERTIEPSPRIKEALKKFIDSGRLQVYPEYGDLEARIAQYAGVKAEQVMITNGGDQGIDIICRAHLQEGDKVIIPQPSFAMHFQSAEIQGAEILEPAYSEDGSFPLKETLDLIDKENDIKLIVLCNPNNPLGTALGIANVEEILRQAKEKEIALLHDEAYFEFSGITAKNLIKKYDNLYIVRTFSKAFGLVATRAGYVLSQEKNLEQLLKIRGPYDVNMFAKTAVLAALEDIGFMRDYVKEVMQESKPMVEQFLRQKNIEFFPSAANFIFLKVGDSQKLFEGLKKEGILVRPKTGPAGRPGIRLSIGTKENTKRWCQTSVRLVSDTGQTSVRHGTDTELTDFLRKVIKK